MVKSLVHVSFIELVETTGERHHENRVLGETFPFYPTYAEGNTIFLNIVRKGAIDPPLPLTPYKIIEIHHSLRVIQKSDSMFETGTTIPSMEVYLRKLD